VIPNEIRVAEPLEVLARAIGQILVPHDVVNLAAAVLADRAREPCGGIAVT
jgi:hypothetical protein